MPVNLTSAVFGFAPAAVGGLPRELVPPGGLAGLGGDYYLAVRRGLCFAIDPTQGGGGGGGGPAVARPGSATEFLRIVGVIQRDATIASNPGAPDRGEAIARLRAVPLDELIAAARRGGEEQSIALGMMHTVVCLSGHPGVVPAYARLLTEEPKVEEAGIWLLSLGQSAPDRGVRSAAVAAFSRVPFSPFDYTVSGEIQRLAETADAAQAPLPTLLMARARTHELEAEEDHRVAGRNFLSERLLESEASDAAGGLTFGLKMTPPFLNVKDLRDNIVLGLHVFITGERNRFFALRRMNWRWYLSRLDADQVYRRQFPHLESLFIDGEMVYLLFDRPIDLPRLTTLLQDPRQRGHFWVGPSRTRPEALAVTQDGTTLLYLTRRGLEIPYAPSARDPEGLVRSINLATRVIEAIEHDRLFSTDFQEVDMGEFAPFFSALTGTRSAADFNYLANFLLGDLARIAQGESPLFRETGPSRRLREAEEARHLPEPNRTPPTYGMAKESPLFPPHGRYLLLETGGSPKLILGSDLTIKGSDARSPGGVNYDFFANAVRGYSDEVEVERTRESRTRQVGGGRPRTTNVWQVYRRVDGTRVLVAEFTPQIHRIPLTIDQPDNFRFAMGLLDHLYRVWPFETGTEHVGRLRGGLTDDERTILPVWNFVRQLHRRFFTLIHSGRVAQALMSVDAAEVRRRTAEGARPIDVEELPPPHIWAATVMAEAPTQTIEGRLLHLYQTVVALVDDYLATNPNVLQTNVTRGRVQGAEVFGEDGPELYSQLRMMIRSLRGGETPPKGTPTAPLPQLPDPTLMESWFVTLFTVARGWDRHTTEAKKRKAIEEAARTAGLDLDQIKRTVAPLDDATLARIEPASLRSNLRMLHDTLFVRCGFEEPTGRS